MSTPQFVEDIRDQVGRGLTGGFCYIGASNLVYGTEPNPFLRFNVNGRRGANWKMTIEVDPMDTYNVWLMDKTGTKLGEVTDVYCDVLQKVVERLYDDAIREHNQGFINLD